MNLLRTEVRRREDVRQARQPQDDDSAVPQHSLGHNTPSTRNGAPFASSSATRSPHVVGRGSLPPQHYEKANS